jgi:hypothetical protein
MEKINFLMLSFLVISCSCYSQHHISVDNLLSQFKDAGSEKHIFVKGNDLKTIKCFNKKEEEEIITITNRTGIRIFQNDGAKKTFYFNTIILSDSTISGSKTNFFNAQVKPVLLKDISRIEVLE